MHNLQFLAFYDLKGRPALCSYCELLLSIKKPFTPWAGDFTLCPKGFFKLKKVCFAEGKYEKKIKEPEPALKGNSIPAICSLASYVMKVSTEITSIK